MTADVAARTHGTGLTIRAEQDWWDDKQLATLRSLGISEVSNADLAVFLHVCKRTGLDPFARQIHMIERRQKDRNGNWRSKWTIQTGIDGLRLIGRRAANERGEEISTPAPQWAHEDGTWRDMWVKAWGYPLAARVTVRRGGAEFTAVAMFEEYAQRSNGDLTAMWKNRPAGMIAKCAEALALRQAFPQDLAGLYSDDEMHQADNTAAQRQARVTVESLRADAPTEVEPVEAEVVDDAPLDLAPMWAAIAAAGITDKGEKGEFVAQFLGRDITGPDDLTPEDVAAVIEEAHTLTGGEPDADRD